MKILDCTLRDGGYTNGWAFLDEQISSVVQELVILGVDIIECGYLSQTRGRNANSSLFSSVEVLENLLEGLDIRSSELVLMVNLGEFDFDRLSEQRGLVRGIRLAFRKEFIKDAVSAARCILNKGYKLYLQPMVISSYDFDEILSMLKEFSDIEYSCICVVDSLGCMDVQDLSGVFDLFDRNVPVGRNIGFHAHGDLVKVKANCGAFMGRFQHRDIIIDASIDGIGRGKGNLPLDVIFDCLGYNVAKISSVKV